MKIIVAITGASGAIYAQNLLNKLEPLHQQKHVSNVSCIFTPTGRQVWDYELETAFHYPNFETFAASDYWTAPASGSSGFDAMVVVPCSMGSMARIAHGVSSDLISRAADVMLKERKKLVLAVRETPYNLIHLRNMETLTMAGAIICPASPSFYFKPTTIEQVVETVTNRILDLIQLPSSAQRWKSL